MRPHALAFDFMPRSRAHRWLTRGLWASAGLAWAIWGVAWVLPALYPPAPELSAATRQAQQATSPDPIWTALWPRLELLALPGVSVETLTVDSHRGQAQLNLLLLTPQQLHRVLAAQQAAAPGRVQLIEQSPLEGQATGSRAQLSLQW